MKCTSRRSLLHPAILLIVLQGLSVPGIVMAQTQAPVTQASNEKPTAISNYKLSPNDLLDFRVFGEPDLDSVVRVAGDGGAIFPLIGSVQIAGRTVADATQIVAARLRDGYLVSPQVSITVRNYSKKLFTILGQVQKPGAYDMEGLDEISLLQAIGMAGGYTKVADPANVTVKRGVSGQQQIMKFNANKMAHGTDKTTIMIRPGDVITVSESMF
jgi:protein involved in polysaccharide export with SLBB domain